jgi:hypothetical protein
MNKQDDSKTKVGQTSKDATMLSTRLLSYSFLQRPLFISPPSYTNLLFLSTPVTMLYLWQIGRGRKRAICKNR